MALQHVTSSNPTVGSDNNTWGGKLNSNDTAHDTAINAIIDSINADPAFAQTVSNLFANTVPKLTVTSVKTSAYTANPGELVLCDIGRSVADGVTNSSATVTSATAAFVAGDVGRAISGAGIPAGATITAVGSATSVTISAAATATATAVVLTIGSSFAVTLPSASSKWDVVVKNVQAPSITGTVGSTAATATAQGTDVINATGTTTLPLRYLDQSKRFTSNGSGLIVVSGGDFSKTVNDLLYANVLGSPSNPVTNASAARPTGLTVVYWLCATQPTNMAAGDVWTDNS